MTEIQLILIEKFEQIKRKEWVLSINQGKGSVGLTFELLLGKPVENFELPDFDGIEIKTHTRSSERDITLFSAAPDGDYLFEIKHLLETYGRVDRVLKDKKVFYGEAYANKESYYNGRYFQLKVNYDEKKVRLCITDHSARVLEEEISWSFALLEEKLCRKLSCLAYIEADKSYLYNKLYFKYQSLTLYELKGFDTFLDLIKGGIVHVAFTVGVVQSGPKKGNVYDHGTAFRIAPCDFERLFIKIFESPC